MNLLISSIGTILTLSVLPNLAWKVWSPSENAKSLNIRLEVNESDLAIPPDLNYTSYNAVHLIGPNAPDLTVEMQKNLSKIETFRVSNGSIDTIHLVTNYKKLIVQNCSTKLVLINPNWIYEMEYFSIVFNKLEKVPENLNALKKLEKVFLHDNQIEFVEMAQFNGLNNLQVLNLHDNKIYEISATQKSPVALPKLEKFFAFKNSLIDITFEHWSANSLREIWIHQNKLQIALHFPAKFPTLKEVTIDHNPFNCKWLETSLGELKARKVIVYDSNLVKCNQTGPPLDEVVHRVKFKEVFVTGPCCIIKKLRN
ncbi:hypothetical protein quinque_006512 [Culex quinquefasciatus]